MKALSAKWIIAGIVVAFVFQMWNCTHTRPRPVDITGNYILYREGDTAWKVVGYMTISPQHGSRFSIGITKPTGNPAIDWKGSGVFKGKKGYYDWVFEDGKTGRTTFRIDNSGRIHGKVRGSGINWDYLAIRQ